MRIIILLAFLLFPVLACAEGEDRVSVQVEFKKALWTCPKCSQEDTTDMYVQGGNDYEHNCSKCGARFNQSGSNMKEYNGCLRYPIADYSKVSEKAKTDEKTKRFNDWVYEVKHPPAYIEPTKEILEQLMAEKQAEVNELQGKINAKIITPIIIDK